MWLSNLTRTAGKWRVVRGGIVTAIFAAISIALLVGEGSPGALIAFVIGLGTPIVVRRRLVDHLEWVTSALRWLGFAILGTSLTAPFWSDHVEARVVLVPLTLLTMFYLSAWACIHADPRVVVTDPSRDTPHR